MKIRRYRDLDHDDVWALHNLVLEDAGAHAGTGPWDNDLHRIEATYLDRAGEFLVGTHSSTIVAIGALLRLSTDTAEIKRMRVHPHFQRQGFGQAVLGALEARAVELGYATLTLDTTVIQVAAQGFYLKNGYSETGRTRVGEFDVVRYEKLLQPGPE